MGRPGKIEHEDGTLTLFDYSYDEQAEQLTTTAETGAPDGSGQAVTNGTRTISVEDAGGDLVSSATEDIASGIQISGMVYTRDAFGRVTCASNGVSGLTPLPSTAAAGPST